MDKIEMTMRKRAGKIYDVFLGEMHLFTASKFVAGPICNSFNEHDTLKAKESLLDDFIAYCSEECSVEIPLGECNIEMTFKINEIMENYKELQ